MTVHYRLNVSVLRSTRVTVLAVCIGPMRPHDKGAIPEGLVIDHLCKVTCGRSLPQPTGGCDEYLAHPTLLERLGSARHALLPMNLPDFMSSIPVQVLRVGTW
jgi:hypothetical protein